MKKDQFALLVILFLTLVVIVYFGFDSRVSLYIVFVALIASIYVTLIGPSLININGVGDYAGLPSTSSSRGRKLMLCYILKQLQERKTIDAKDLIVEVGLDLKELTSTLNFLKDQGVLKLIYPPLKEAPIIVQEDGSKADVLLKKLVSSLNAGTNVKDEEFLTAVEEQFNKSRSRPPS